MADRKRFALRVDLRFVGTVIVESEETEESAIYNAVMAVKERLYPDGLQGPEGCWYHNHFYRDYLEMDEDPFFSQQEIDATPREHLDIDWRPKE